MANNKEIVFESNRGIIFERTLFNNGKARLAVRFKDNNKMITDYRYTNAPGLQSPYLNWENLNCVDGWIYDKTYLHTAVQNDKKLYAGICFSIAKEEMYSSQALPPCFYTEGEVAERVEAMTEGLPGDCVLGVEGPDSDRLYSTLRYIYICKTGAIQDYIDVDDVVSVYGRFGINLDDSHIYRIKELCSVEISSFADNTRMDYGNPNSVAEWVATGLLLGYPIETTASILGRAPLR